MAKRNGSCCRGVASLGRFINYFEVSQSPIGASAKTTKVKLAKTGYMQGLSGTAETRPRRETCDRKATETPKSTDGCHGNLV
jgi:hypothetical protein